MKKAIQIKVYGIVQGVFFRKHTQDIAFRMDLKGWVKNCDDGSVEIEAEGEENVLNEFIVWCRNGPGKASVTKIEMKEISLSNFSSFEVRK